MNKIVRVESKARLVAELDLGSIWFDVQIHEYELEGFKFFVVKFDRCKPYFCF